MICSRCSKENADHYKFCLGCGAELTKPVPESLARTVMAEPAAAQPAGGPRPCPSCGFAVPEGFRFCGQCGSKIDVPAAAAAPPPAAAPAPAPAPAATMTLIRPDGSEGGTIYLKSGENKVGRAHDPLLANDGYLSPHHATVIVGATQAVIRDSSSLNGVFVRIEQEFELKPGTIFRVGQELLRFDTLAPPAPLEDGTEVMGSPNPGYWGRVSVIVGKNQDGAAFPLLEESVHLGRERGDINFPDDGYVSGLHAKLTHRAGRVTLADVGSSNGTFVKLEGEATLTSGSFVLLGQQLFRLGL